MPTKTLCSELSRAMADQGTEGILSPFLRFQRLKAVRPYLKGMILDVGCGVGKLAKAVSPERYIGVEVDLYSLQNAIENFPEHRFQAKIPCGSRKFNTIVALAVIEHVDTPVQFLTNLCNCLKFDKSSRIILTTPHPSIDWIHNWGSSVGLFSKHANEEHERLLDRSTLESISSKVGLNVVLYRRFLLGANQLVVLERV